jgi:molecular chaperone IbpA|tara:strand:+ start:170 stop:619 length:450 start_codon:yes stop_codon:yes gene_type:complete
MTNKALSIFNRLRPVSVGFDSIFDHFGSMWDDDFINDIQPSYPPYNIVKSGKNTYDIEVALAGFNKKDINVEVENGMLTIETKQSEKETDKDEDGKVLHKGISKRYFKRSFTIANDVKVKGAELKDGLLKVSMEKIVPEEMKLKTIDVK